MNPVILNTKFIKRESKTSYPQYLTQDLPDCEPTFITTTRCLTYSMMRRLKLLYIHLQQFKVLEQSWRLFTFLKLCKCSKNPHSASRVASNSNKNQPPFAQSSTSEHSTHIKLRHLACSCADLREMNSRKKKWSSSTRQIGLKAGRRDAPLALRDFRTLYKC